MDDVRGSGPRRPSAAGLLPAAVVVAATVAVLAPALAPGYVLTYDMVFVPRLPVTADLFGLGSQTPRAVPSDLVVSVLSHAVPGQAVQKVILLALLLAAGTGAARLLHTSPVGRAAAGLAYLWSPFLGEHLLLGQWAVLVGYATLPWIVSAADSVRHGRAGAWPRLLLVLGICSCGGAPAWTVALLSAVLVAGWPRAGEPPAHAIRRVLGVLGALTCYALPWAVPSLLRPGGTVADIAGAAVFSARADTHMGVVGSLLTGGGIWNSAATPPGRAAIAYSIGVLLLLALVARGLPLCRGYGWFAPLAVSAGIGLALALATVWSPSRTALAHLPGGALLRDGERLAVVWVLLAALAFGACVGAVPARWGPGVPAVVALLPVVLLPSLAWGVSGRLVPVRYPPDYAAVSRIVDRDPRPGGVLVLPFSAYRRYSWNGARVQLDPLPRWFDRTVVASSDLPVVVGGRTVVVAGEDRLAARLSAAATGSAPMAPALAAAGIRWVVVDAPQDPATLSGLTRVYAGSVLSLYDVDGVDPARAADPARGDAPPRVPVVIGDLLALAALLSAACVAGCRTGRQMLLCGRNRPEG